MSNQRKKRVHLGVRQRSDGKYIYSYKKFIKADLKVLTDHKPVFKTRKMAQADWDKEVIRYQPIRQLCLEHKKLGCEVISLSQIFEYLEKIEMPREDIHKIRWGLQCWQKVEDDSYPINALYLDTERELLQEKIKGLYPRPKRLNTRKGCQARINQLLKKLILMGILPEGLRPLVTTGKPIPIQKTEFHKPRPDFTALRLMVSYAKWLIQSPFISDRICGTVLILYMKFDKFCLSHASKIKVKDITYRELTLPPRGRARYSSKIDISRMIELFRPFIAGKGPEAYVFSTDTEGHVPYNWVIITEKYRAIRKYFNFLYKLCHFQPSQRRRRTWGVTRFGQ